MKINDSQWFGYEADKILNLVISAKKIFVFEYGMGVWGVYICGIMYNTCIDDVESLTDIINFKEETYDKIGVTIYLLQLRLGIRFF